MVDAQKTVANLAPCSEQFLTTVMIFDFVRPATIVELLSTLSPLFLKLCF